MINFAVALLVAGTPNPVEPVVPPSIVVEGRVASPVTDRPIGSGTIGTVEVSRLMLSYPDVLAPALRPYVSCLLTSGPVNRSSPPPDCSVERAVAQRESIERLRKRMSEYERADLVEAFLQNIEILAQDKWPSKP